MTLGNMRAIFGFRRDGVLGARVGEVVVDRHVSEGTILDVAWRHVHNGRRIIACQRGLVEHLRTTGRDVSNAERTLELFERSQTIFEDHLRQLEAERLVAGVR
jgi:hypothetical protein